MTRAHLLDLADGRTLEVLEAGDPAGSPLVFHGGSPSAAVDFPALDRAATQAGLRVLTASRPGYGASTPRPRPDGPHMVDDVADTVAALDALGVAEFVTLGWSGGGPRAIACAAELPGRCRAALSLAGVAPRNGAGLDWFAGMAPENVAEYTAADAGPAAYTAYLERDFLPVLDAGVDDIVEALGALVTPVDVAALLADDRELARFLTANMHAAGAQGVVGVRDDGLAAVAPWGFDLDAVTVPVLVWQGTHDAMVPPSHGAWLGEHVAGARFHLVEGEGHLSLVSRLPEMLTELRAAAR